MKKTKQKNNVFESYLKKLLELLEVCKMLKPTHKT